MDEAEYQERYDEGEPEQQMQHHHQHIVGGLSLDSLELGQDGDRGHVHAVGAQESEPAEHDPQKRLEPMTDGRCVRAAAAVLESSWDSRHRQRLRIRPGQQLRSYESKYNLKMILPSVG